VRGGRVSVSKKKIADLLHVSPILSINNEGAIIAEGKIFGYRNKDAKFIQYIDKKIPQENSCRIGIVHGNCEQRARKFEKYFINKIGENSVFFSQIGPGLGTHAGTNAIAIAVQTLEN
jgi:fatty acid-binding protein DegV